MGMQEDLKSHAKWLRQCGNEIAKEGHNGWGNTCFHAADSMDKHHAEIQRNAEDAARYKFICDAFDHMKTSTSERFLECLNLDDGTDVCLPLDKIISTAMIAQAEPVSVSDGMFERARKYDCFFCFSHDELKDALYYFVTGERKEVLSATPHPGESHE
jgi:hypothetical protein